MYLLWDDVASTQDLTGGGAGCFGNGVVFSEFSLVVLNFFVNGEDVFLLPFGEVIILAGSGKQSLYLYLSGERVGDSISMLDCFKNFNVFCAAVVGADVCFVTVVKAGSRNGFNQRPSVSESGHSAIYFYGSLFSCAHCANVLNHFGRGAGCRNGMSFPNVSGRLQSGDVIDRAVLALLNQLTVSGAGSLDSGDFRPAVSGGFDDGGGELIAAEFAGFDNLACSGAGSFFGLGESCVVFVSKLGKNGGSTVFSATCALNGFVTVSGAGRLDLHSDFAVIVAESIDGSGYILITAQRAHNVFIAVGFAGCGNNGYFGSIVVSELINFGKLLFAAVSALFNDDTLRGAGSFGLGDNVERVISNVAVVIILFYGSAINAGSLSVSGFLAGCVNDGDVAVVMYTGFGDIGGFFLIANGAAFLDGTCSVAGSVYSADFFVVVITGSGIALNVNNFLAGRAGSDGISGSSAGCSHYFIYESVSGSEQSFAGNNGLAILANDGLASVLDASCVYNRFGSVKMTGCRRGIGFFLVSANGTGLNRVTAGRASGRNYFRRTVAVILCRRRFHISVTAVVAGVGNETACGASCGVFAETELRMGTFFVASSERHASHAHDNQRQQGNQ